MVHVNSKQIIIALVFFMVGLAVMYFYSSNSYKAKLVANKEITLSIIDNSIAAFETTDALVSNCSDAYLEVATCFSDFNSCNLNRSAKRLSELELEKEQIQVKLKEVIEEMDLIIAKKQSLQN